MLDLVSGAFKGFLVLAVLALPCGADVIGSPGVPATAVERVSKTLREAGIGTLSVRLLNLASPADAADFRKRSGQKYERGSSGQGYIIDLTRENQAIIAGDGALGVWYGALAFQDLLKREGNRFPRAVIRESPDIESRMFHLHGFDKGYGAGDRWTARDLETGVFRFIDAASQARMTSMYLSFEAGWINEADKALKINVDEVLGKIIRYARARMVGIVVELEYAAMPDKAQVDRVSRQIRNFEISGAQARAKVSDLRKPLCAVAQGDYYLKAARRVLSLQPAGLVISFNDFPARSCDDCLRVYGTKDIRFHGKALAKIAQDVDAIRRQQAPEAKLYFLPRFYGPTHWKAHPDALPELIANSPRGMATIITGDQEAPYVASLRDKYGAHFVSWQNLTSNHMKDKKVWFPVAEFSAPGEEEKLRKKPQSAIILNLGAPPGPQVLSILMGGAWLWSRQGYRSEEVLEKSARLIFGAEAAPLIGSYGSLISQPVMWESLGGNIVERLRDRPKLESWVETWNANMARAAKAEAVARRISAATAKTDPEFGPILERNAERIRQDYEIALLFGRMVLARAPNEAPLLNARLRELGAFIQRCPVIPNDAKDAEVISRGFRTLQEPAAKLGQFVANPGRPKPTRPDAYEP